MCCMVNVVLSVKIVCGCCFDTSLCTIKVPATHWALQCVYISNACILYGVLCQHRLLESSSTITSEGGRNMFGSVFHMTL